MQSNVNKKVAVAMSGGVDSSTVAALLKTQGYSVVGIFMQNWTEPGCRTPQDRADAVKVASHLDILFDVWDFEKEYREKVIEYFYREYESGRTPNPDVMCNKEIKFKLFFDRAFKELNVDYIATGHYAISREGKLYEGKDPKKDQSYFLCQLTEAQLKKTLFPLGELTKPQVRQLAFEFKLPVAEKPDSQGICFVGEVNVREFLKKRLKTRVGKIVTVDGNLVGEHEGVAFYTIGQRHGFNVGGGVPYYVAGKDAQHNILYVSKLNDERYLYSTEIDAEEWHEVNKSVVEYPIQVQARIRYQQPKQEAVLTKLPNSRVKFTFKQPQRAATPGQSVVAYLPDGQVLGAAVISDSNEFKLTNTKSLVGIEKG